MAIRSSTVSYRSLNAPQGAYRINEQHPLRRSLDAHLITPFTVYVRGRYLPAVSNQDQKGRVRVLSPLGALGTVHNNAFSGQGVYTPNLPVVVATTTPITLSVWGVHYAPVADRKIAIAMDSGGGGNCVTILWSDTANEIQVWSKTAAATVVRLSGVVPVAGTLYHVVVVNDPPNAVLSCYVNGLLSNSTLTGTVTTRENTGANYKFGGFDSGNSSMGLDGPTAFHTAWTRVLTDAEIYSLYNPTTRWDMFTVPSHRVFFDVGAATTFIYQPQYGHAGIIPSPRLVFHQAHTRPPRFAPAVVTPPIPGPEVPLLARPYSVAFTAPVSVRGPDRLPLIPPVDVPAVQRPTLSPPRIPTPMRVDIIAPIPPANVPLVMRGPLVPGDGAAPPWVVPPVVPPPRPMVDVPVLPRAYVAPPETVRPTSPPAVVPYPIPPSLDGPLYTRRWLPDTLSIAGKATAPPIAGPDVPLHRRVPRVPDAQAAPPIPPAVVPRPIPPVEALVLPRIYPLLVNGVMPVFLVAPPVAPIPGAFVPNIQRPVAILVDGTQPITTVPAVIAPIPPALSQPVIEVKPITANLSPAEMRPLFPIAVPAIPQTPTADPSLLPRAIVPLYPIWFAPPPSSFTSHFLIRRVTRWTAEDRTAVIAAAPRTVRWTRDARSVNMPERDDHYV